MIRVSFSGMTLTLRGHAGAAPYGQDLVCAAVSALVYALAQRLTELDRQGALQCPPQIRLSSGNARISALAKGEQETKVAEDFRLIHSGLKLLESHYPKQINVIKKGTIYE